jgi:group I intron endonuclease
MHVYKFTHLESGKSYVGQTIQDPARRRLEHISGSRYSTNTYHFHNAIRKYGIDAFTFEVLAEATSLAELNNLEEQFANQFDCYHNGYNIRKAGGNKLHSEESKKRMSESQKLAHAKRKKEGRDTFNKIQKTSGWAWSDEQKQKLQTRDRSYCKGRTWKLLDGKRVWIDLGASV